MNIVNLTPHSLNVENEQGEIVEIKPSGVVARVSEVRTQIGSVEGFPIYKVTYGEPENMPDPEEGTVYIVSALLAQRMPEREDVYVPGEAIRDSNGKIVGSKGFASLHKEKYGVFTRWGWDESVDLVCTFDNIQDTMSKVTELRRNFLNENFYLSDCYEDEELIARFGYDSEGCLARNINFNALPDNEINDIWDFDGLLEHENIYWEFIK